jgi:HTH-type transcriptional regulator/antitoxin HigA
MRSLTPNTIGGIRDDVMKKKKTGEVIDNCYFELVRRFPLRPLANDTELDRAIAVINELVDRGFKNLTNGEEAYLDVLSDLVEKYENIHHSIPDVSPTEMLKLFIDDRHTNQRAVALSSGIAASTMSEILAGRRRMNLDHMHKLAKFFKIDVGVFLPKSKQQKLSSRKLHAAKK